LAVVAITSQYAQKTIQPAPMMMSIAFIALASSLPG
jgi:hypothetical protein